MYTNKITLHFFEEQSTIQTAVPLLILRGGSREQRSIVTGSLTKTMSQMFLGTKKNIRKTQVAEARGRQVLGSYRLNCLGKKSPFMVPAQNSPERGCLKPADSLFRIVTAALTPQGVLFLNHSPRCQTGEGSRALHGVPAPGSCVTAYTDTLANNTTVPSRSRQDWAQCLLGRWKF